MKAVDIVIKEIADRGLSQAEAAKLVGISRQNLWDKLNKGNPRFNSMEKILNAFGYRIEVCKIGEMLDFDPETFLESIRRINPIYDELTGIIEAMGYFMEYVRKESEKV